MDAILEYLIKIDGGKVIALIGLLMWLDMRKKLDRAIDCLSDMGIGHATLVERVDGHDKRLENHEKRIDRVEEKIL